MSERYDVVFSCYWANYYWAVKEDAPLEDAEKLTLEKNKGRKIHGNGCCQYFIQKRMK